MDEERKVVETERWAPLEAKARPDRSGGAEQGLRRGQS
jgi:hypothetical protein